DLDQAADVDRLVLANEDVLAAGREGVARADGDPPGVARVADDLQAAGHAPAVQVAVVKLVLLDDVALELVEVLVGEELAGEETWAAQADEASAGRTAGRVVRAGIALGSGSSTRPRQVGVRRGAAIEPFKHGQSPDLSALQDHQLVL